MEGSLNAARRLVIKIGSSILTGQEGRGIRQGWLDSLVEDLAVWVREGREAVIVSSGGVALGRRILGLASDVPCSLEEKQAASACGQVPLAVAYQQSFTRYAIPVAQILVTIEDTEDRRRYLNARQTVAALLKHGVVPVFNENDTVATQELRIGDNDRLAARVAQMVSADALVLLSDVDGLYTANPAKDAAAAHVPKVEQITAEIEAMAGMAGTLGSGGMVTKLTAAKIAMNAGCHAFIAKGYETHPLAALREGRARATWFVASDTPYSARKHWIAGTLEPAGAVHIDAGALAALRAGNSLLPAGVRTVSGTFERGDPVTLTGPDGEEIGRGLIAYAADEARRITGRQSREIPGILGYAGRDVLIHRDDMVVFGEGG